MCSSDLPQSADLIHQAQLQRLAARPHAALPDFADSLRRQLASLRDSGDELLINPIDESLNGLAIGRTRRVFEKRSF